MNKYREDVLNKKPYIDAERAVLATKAYDEHKEKPNVLKRAYMLKEILENMTLYIEDETMIRMVMKAHLIKMRLFSQSIL